MKLNKKKVIALALVVCLIATLSMGSLAWFTDDDSVTNDFFIAGSEDQNPDDVFSIDVWEDATPEDPDGEDKIQDGIDYDAILPGDDLYKEVNVENTGSYPQYVRVTVTVSDANIWQEIYGETFVPLQYIATDLSGDFDSWSATHDETNNSLIYVLYYDGILAVDQVVTLFTNVAIPEDLDRYQAAQMAGGFQVIVNAEAVQTENVGDTAPEAFETVGLALPEGNITIISNIDVENKNAGYAYNLLNPTQTVFNNVDIVAEGAIQAAFGAQVEFNSGSIELDSAATSQRYTFYAASPGTKVVVNGGDFSFEQYRKRSYACAVNGAVIEIYGGNFGVAPNHPKWTAPIYEEGGEVIIYGGTFGFNPTEWVADGYEAVQNGSTWTVQAK